MIIPITINNKIHLDIQNIPDTLVQEIKKKLTILNPEWLCKKKAGKYLQNINEKIWFYEEKDSKLIIPRGFLKKLTTILSPHNPTYVSKDGTRLLQNININMKHSSDDNSIWSFQDKAVNSICNKPSAVLNFPTGGGKTITGIKLICKRKQPTLIVVHSKELLYQWRDSLLEFSDIETNNIGLIGDGNNSTGIVTIAIINSLYNKIHKISHLFGQVIIDEAHRTPGRCFKQVIGQMDCYYVLGLSATPKRGDYQTKAIFFYCGNQEYEIKPPELMDKQIIIKPKLEIRQTSFIFDPTNGNKCQYGGSIGEDFNKLGIKCKNCPKEAFQNCWTVKQIMENKWLYVMDELVENSKRNQLIINDVVSYFTSIKNMKPKKTALVISDRIEHCELLAKKLRETPEINVVVLTSHTPNKDRKKIILDLKNGQVDALIAGCKLIGEGFDCKYLSSIFLTTPISFDMRLIQYVGRILRRVEDDNKEALIYDYVDIHVPMLMRSFKKRIKGYNKLGLNIIF